MKTSNFLVAVLNEVCTVCEYIMINGKNSDFKNVNESLKELLEDVTNNFHKSISARLGELECLTDDYMLEVMSDGLTDSWTVQVVLIAVDLYKKCKKEKLQLVKNL